MKFAIITDSHIGPSPFYRGTNRIMSYMSEVVISEIAEEINSDREIAFVGQLGDMSQDDLRYPCVAFEEENFKRALWYFTRLSAPVYHAVGNHDRSNLDEERLCRLLGYPTLHYSFDIADIHCVFLYTKHHNHQDMVVDETQLQWLRDDLSATNKRTLVFMHHSIADQDLTGNFWFEGAPHKALVSNREEIRAILEESGKVIGVFNGHLHWNNLTIHNSIPYFSIQSCIEDISNNGTPSKSYAIVTVEGLDISVEVRGIEPKTFSSRTK